MINISQYYRGIMIYLDYVIIFNGNTYINIRLIYREILIMPKRLI